MTKKLFYVEVTKSGWVLAESSDDAEEFADEILDDEICKKVDVFPYSEEYLKVSGWNETFLVYHSEFETNDITIGDALK
jgi:hypothetical protein